MPLSISVAGNEMVMRTYFFEKKISCEKLLSIQPASPFLPEGLMLKTKSGSFLIGANMNAVDELQDLLTEKISMTKK